MCRSPAVQAGIVLQYGVRVCGLEFVSGAIEGSGHAPAGKFSVQRPSPYAETSGGKRPVSAAFFKDVKNMAFFRLIKAIASVVPAQFFRDMGYIPVGGVFLSEA